MDQTIIFNVKNVSDNINYLGVFSDTFRVGNCTWTLHLKSDNSIRTDNINHLSVYCHCNKDDKSVEWRCTADLDFRVFTDKMEHRVMLRQCEFEPGSRICGISKFLDWRRFSENFVIGNISNFDLRISSMRYSGLSRKYIDFTKPESFRCDSIYVDGLNLFVNMQILCIDSSYFYDQRSSPNEIHIEKIKAKDFINYLEIVHNCNWPITQSGLNGLLQIGQKLKSRRCMEESEKYLILSDMSIYKKLKHAETFDMKYLMKSCMNSLKSIDAIVEITGKLNTMSANLKTAIFDRSMEIKNNMIMEEMDTVLDPTSNVVKCPDIGGIPWCVKQSEGSMEILCNYEDRWNPWSCEATIKIYSDLEDIDYYQNFEFKSFQNFLKLKSLKVRVCRIIITVHSISGILDLPRDTDKMKNMRLKVGNRKFHVNNQILVTSSTYFQSPTFLEATENEEIEITDVDPADFDEFSQHIYHPRTDITAKNLEKVLKTATLFHAEELIKKVEHYLRYDKIMGDARILYYADTYHLGELKEEIISKITSFEDLKQLSKCDGFQELSSDVIAGLTLKILKLE